MIKLNAILIACTVALAFCSNASAISYNEAIRQTNKLEGKRMYVVSQGKRVRGCGSYFKKAQLMGVFLLPRSESANAYLQKNRMTIARNCKISKYMVGSLQRFQLRLDTMKATYIGKLLEFEIGAVTLAQKINRRLKSLSNNGSDPLSRDRAARLKTARKTALAAARSARFQIVKAQAIGVIK